MFTLVPASALAIRPSSRAALRVDQEDLLFSRDLQTGSLDRLSAGRGAARIG
jgi:hypothetical protein